jgi:hypothetical protein
MTDQPSSAAIFRSFVTDDDVRLGDRVIIPAGSKVDVRRPGSGEMRGLSLLAISQLDVLALETLAPRITTPALSRGCVMSPADLMQFGTEVLDFLLPRAAKDAVSPTT